MIKTITRLENAITDFANNSEVDNAYDAELLAACGEALGVLRTISQFNLKLNLKHIMYDMARLAGHAGHVPEDFTEKAVEE